MIEKFNLHYAERIGDPVKSTNYTESYICLCDATIEECVAFAAKWDWIRAQWVAVSIDAPSKRISVKPSKLI